MCTNELEHLKFLNNLVHHKKVFLVTVIFILIASSIFRKRWIYVMLSLPFLYFAFIMFIPLNSALIKKNSNIYILPTAKSTLFHRAKVKQEVEILVQKKRYSKILLQNGSIGWIKNENIKKINSIFIFR